MFYLHITKVKFFWITYFQHVKIYFSWNKVIKQILVVFLKSEKQTTDKQTKNKNQNKTKNKTKTKTKVFSSFCRPNFPPSILNFPPSFFLPFYNFPSFLPLFPLFPFFRASFYPVGQQRFPGQKSRGLGEGHSAFPLPPACYATGYRKNPFKRKTAESILYQSHEMKWDDDATVFRHWLSFRTAT